MRWLFTGLKARRSAPRAVGSALLVAFALALLPSVLLAQAGDVVTSAVVRFQDKSDRKSPLLEAKATDAVALALADSREYLVTPAREVEREMAALGMQSPVSTAQAVRLGKRLDVDSVTIGEVLKATVDDRSGKAHVRLQIMMVDVAAEELLDGAVVSTETKAIPGWSGTEAEILNEALRQAAEQVVSEMLSRRVPRGTVEVVLPSGTCEIGLGSQDGVTQGMKMVVMRPVYIPERETVSLRKIGRVEIGSTHADICYANPVRDTAPRTGDYVLRIYEPDIVIMRIREKQSRTKFVAGIAALALLGAFAAIATNGNENSAPPTPISYLHQNAMGDTPVIRIQFGQPNKGHGHLLFRGRSAGFPASAPYLVEVFASPSGGEETRRWLDDQPQAAAQQSLAISVSFRDEDGDPDTEDVDIEWTHPALIPGETYFHKVRRVTKPAFPPGTNPPLSQTGGTESVSQDPTNTITDPHQFPMVSRATRVVGPVTYILPVQLVAPPNNAPPQNTSAITFEWSPTVGGDEFAIEVFPSDDANGVRQPIFRRDSIRARGASTISETWRPATGDLAPNDLYYWRVGVRRSMEVGPGNQGIPRVGFGGNELQGYVLSTMRSFTTAPIPPPEPGPSGTAKNVKGNRGPRAAGAGETDSIDPPDPKQARRTRGQTRGARAGKRAPKDSINPPKPNKRRPRKAGKRGRLRQNRQRNRAAQRDVPFPVELPGM